jgi:hypothetical protein
MITIDENLLAIWWIALPSMAKPGTNEADLLCSLARRSPEECEIIYRFRYYETKGAWDGLDRKNWYDGVVKQQPEEIIPHLRAMFEKLSALAGGSKVFEIVRGDMTIPQFIDEFAKMPFVHMKSGDDAERWLKEHEHQQRAQTPYRAPLPMHYAPNGGHRIACPIEVIGTNITAEPGDVTCKRCAKHADVVNYRNNLRDKPPHA